MYVHTMCIGQCQHIYIYTDGVTKYDSWLSQYIKTYCEHVAVAQWLRHCATNRKVAGSIPDGVTGIFH
jgi:hypothetical protein